MPVVASGELLCMQGSPLPPTGEIRAASKGNLALGEVDLWLVGFVVDVIWLLIGFVGVPTIASLCLGSIEQMTRAFRILRYLKSSVYHAVVADAQTIT